jgi:hypothetical protein
MAALNKSETETLREITSLLEYIQRNGYDAESGKAIKTEVLLSRKVEEAKRRIRTLVSMK